MQKTDHMTAEQFRDYIKTKTLPSKSKYNAKPKEVDGIRFSSTKEADRYVALKLMQNGNEITALQRQVKFKLVGCTYFLDFMYFDYSTKQMVYEDTKGMRLSSYKIKKRQMFELYGITILET